MANFVPEILVVNQDALARGALLKALKATGRTVVAAESGLAAIKVLQTTPVQLVITDIDTGHFDGWRLARIIRSGIYRCNANVPIIVVTKSWCERITEITAREFGINHLLPFEHLFKLPSLVSTCFNSGLEGLAGPRLLIVEDHVDNARLVSRILRHRFDIEIQHDGLAGFNAWQEKRHDLVLLDVMLPKLSGPQVLDKILAIAPQQPVVIMTAHGTMDLAEELMARGAVDFVAKPFRSEQLRQVCELASRREDYMVSNAQVAARLESLHESTQAYRKISEEHQRLLDNLSSVVIELDEQGQMRFLSQAWSRLTGFPIEESLGKQLVSYLSFEGQSQKAHYSLHLRELLAGTTSECEFELPLVTSRGQLLWLNCKLDRVESASQGTSIFGCLEDISKRKLAQQQLEFLAMHDNLTGIKNRHYFDNVLSQMAASAARGKHSHTLLYIDLDHFKVINDTFGHNHGDIVLRDIANLLTSRLRKSDVLCRIGGDEFAVLIYDSTLVQAKQTADAIRKLLKDYQYLQSGLQLELSCSIGLCEINGSADCSDSYLKQADKALYVAKKRGRNMVHVYNPEDKESEELRNSIDWVRRFRKAIHEQQLRLMFQPIMHIDSREITYYEALIRLEDPVEGLILPGAFIPALESAGEMGMLDHWVIRQVIELLSYTPQLQRVAINLSAQAFRDESLLPLVEQELREHQLDPARIIFELTESASMANVAATQRMINQLHQLGCGLALDDFGTGFSTFSYLKQFPAESIKIDGSFISKLDQSSEDQAVVRAITDVAKALGKKTVAEYVENDRVLTLLQDMGIDYAQGYFIGRPATVESIFSAPNQLLSNAFS